ncbi:MAG TPA: hypothetical protein VGE25_12905 [Sediminibacterium sp.]
MTRNQTLILSLLFSFLFGNVTSQAQKTTFTPELVTGYRSLFYQHGINHFFSKKLRFNNMVVYDTEYRSDKNNIFFIRNTLCVALSKPLSLQTAIGIKNPGSFATLALQYQYQTGPLRFLYAAGATYQTGLTLEQSLILEYNPLLQPGTSAYFRLQAIANTDFTQYQRGIQQFRAGIQQESTQYGVALNLDQFNNGARQLENAGIFIRYLF